MEHIKNSNPMMPDFYKILSFQKDKITSIPRIPEIIIKTLTDALEEENLLFRNESKQEFEFAMWAQNVDIPTRMKKLQEMFDHQDAIWKNWYEKYRKIIWQQLIDVPAEKAQEILNLLKAIYQSNYDFHHGYDVVVGPK